MIRISRNILAVLTTVFPLSLFAAESLQNSSFAGWYGGIGGGGVFSQIKTNTTSTLSFPSSAFFSSNQNNATNANASVLGNIFVGYLYPVKNFYIGPEIYISASDPNFSTSQTANATLPTESLSTSVNGHLNTFEFGIDLRLGAQVTPTTLIYGLIGAAFNQFTLNASSTIARPVLPLTTAVSVGSTENVIGFRVGAGIEQKLFPKVNLRANYVFTHYPSYSVSGSTPASTVDPFQLGPIANSTTARVNSNAIQVAIVYQFDNLSSGK